MIGVSGQRGGLNPEVSWLLMAIRSSAPRARVRVGAFAGMVIGFGLVLLFSIPCPAQFQDESAVRAAFVFNLTKYVEWPHPGDEIVIGFVGDEHMGETLRKTLAGKTVESRPIRVVLSPTDDELQHCHLLYITHSSSKTLHAALDKVRSKGVLTVGDTDSFTREGGIIGLVRSGEQIQIQVNLEMAQESQLKISSRLLNLATLVKSAPGVHD